MDATTTAVFSSVGLSPSTLTTFLQVVFNQALLFMIYILETVWPFLLVLGLIGVIVGIAYAMLHRHR